MQSRTPLCGHPLNTDTSLLYGQFFNFIYGKRKPCLAFSLNSNHLFRTPLMRQRTLFSCSINRFSYKINLANADTSFSTVCCDKPHFILKIKKLSVDIISTFPALQRTEQDEENDSFDYVRYNVRLIESFECFQVHSTRNKGFGKFRDVQLDNSSLLAVLYLQNFVQKRCILS